MNEHDDYTVEVEQWIQQSIADQKSHADKKPFIGDRPYRHIDSRISLRKLDTNEAERVKLLLSHPNRLLKHSFYPFLRKDKKFRRFSKQVIGSRNKTVIKQKVRPIMYASHIDSCVYGFYGYLLKQGLERELNARDLSSTVIAYRRIPRNGTNRNKSNIDFVNDIYSEIRKQTNAAVVCIDIERFFDTLNHKFLKEKWKQLLNLPDLPLGHGVVYKNITSYRYIFLYQAMATLRLGTLKKGGKFVYSKGAKTTGSLTASGREYNRMLNNNEHIHKNKRQKGIPQGSPISDVLANIYLLNFDEALTDWLKANGGGIYKRYSDDVLVVCNQDNVSNLYEHIKSTLNKEKLAINPKKTEVFFVDASSKTIKDQTKMLEPNYKQNRKSIQYLGFEFDLNDINIRSGTIAKHYRRFKLKVGNENNEETRKKKPKQQSVQKKRDRFAYIRQSIKRINGNGRLESQLKNVKKREAKIRDAAKNNQDK